MGESAKGQASWWILASHEDEALLASHLGSLARRHGAPLFHPHLTLIGDIPAPPESLFEATDRLAAGAAGFTAPVIDIVTGEAFFRSFYALFEAPAALAELRMEAAQTLSLDPGPFMPHVSLLYGAVPERPKQESAARTRAALQGRAIRFDRLALVNSSNDVPLADWRVLRERRLGG